MHNSYRKSEKINAKITIFDKNAEKTSKDGWRNRFLGVPMKINNECLIIRRSRMVRGEALQIKSTII